MAKKKNKKLYKNITIAIFFILFVGLVFHPREILTVENDLNNHEFITFAALNDSNWDLFVYDVNAKSVKRLTNTSIDEREPSISYDLNRKQLG